MKKYVWGVGGRRLSSKHFQSYIPLCNISNSGHLRRKAQCHHHVPDNRNAYPPMAAKSHVSTGAAGNLYPCHPCTLLPAERGIARPSRRRGRQHQGSKFPIQDYQGSLLPYCHIGGGISPHPHFLPMQLSYKRDCEDG